MSFLVLLIKKQENEKLKYESQLQKKTCMYNRSCCQLNGNTNLEPEEGIGKCT